MRRVPAAEAWLWRNPDALASVQRGLADAAQGRFVGRELLPQNEVGLERLEAWDSAPEQLGRAAVIGAIRARVIEVLGSEAKADSWLWTRNRALGGDTPFARLAAGDRQAVLDVLGRIEHGVFE